MVGTRRSARSALFTPTTVRTRQAARYDYKWLSAGRPGQPGQPGGGGGGEDGDARRTMHTSYARLKRSSDTALPASSSESSSSSSSSESESDGDGGRGGRAGSPTPNAKAAARGSKVAVAVELSTPTRKGKPGKPAPAAAAKARAPKAKRKGDEARFALGDGVQVAVEGGKEGVGVLVALWEEPAPDTDTEADGADAPTDGKDAETRMMARIHWCFRRQDLPSVMRNLELEDVSGLGSGPRSGVNDTADAPRTRCCSRRRRRAPSRPTCRCRC